MIAKQITFLANGVNLACALQSFEPVAETEALDATVLCDTYRRYQQGFKNGQLSASGIWEYDSATNDKIHEVMSSAFNSGAEQIVTASLEALTIGGTAILMNANTQGYGIETEIGQLIIVNLDLQSKNAVNFGRWLISQQINAGTINGTTVDDAAGTANGGIFHVHLHNNNASDVDVKVQHSTNGTTWVDLASVDNLSATRTAGSVEVPKGTTVNRYLRAVATVTGGNTVLVSAAFARR